MCDTFHPLKLTALAKETEDPSYAYSWYEGPDAAKEAKNADEDPAGVTSHF
jgi:homogentisate 1,2-dioxygenase